MTGWNIADVLEVVAAEVPGSPAVIQGGRVVTWRELDQRAGRVADRLLGAGLPRRSSVAQYLRNSPEYIESLYACLKASLVPVNTNYRYGSDELVYLWDNADVRAVVFHGEFSAQIELIRSRLPEIRSWLWVDDGTGPRPGWAVSYEDAAAGTGEGPGPRLPPGPDQEERRQRSGDDLLLLYTGGTTGMPKGVMWRQDDLFILLGNAARGGYPDQPDLEYARSRVAREGRRMLPAAPLMHGAGCFSCMPILARGGAIVLLEGHSFDPVEFLDTVDTRQVHSASWVGDAFARPVAEALDAHPGRWHLSSLKAITSGGVVFTEATKRRLLAHAPHLLINDVFGASEAITVGSSLVTKDNIAASDGSFRPRPGMRVIDEAGQDVVPGSGVAGLIAFSGRQPVGYYKDERKTAEVFQEIGGRRYSVPGDWAVVAPDGTVTLLGRGSACINTGGEKVYPDEVEKVIATLRGVADAVVIGVPHERFGQTVVAVVQTAPGDVLTADAVMSHCKAHLAGYKAPREVIFVASIGRGPTGKVDLNTLRKRAVAELGVRAT
jgi:acyl-CoA synthetase (AMP-forming)/AMP-acid ligase II